MNRLAWYWATMFVLAQLAAIGTQKLNVRYDWHDMATAPKDGREILVVKTFGDPKFPIYYQVQWLRKDRFAIDRSGWWTTQSGDTVVIDDPEAWMPIRYYNGTTR